MAYDLLGRDQLAAYLDDAMAGRADEVPDVLGALLKARRLEDEGDVSRIGLRLVSQRQRRGARRGDRHDRLGLEFCVRAEIAFHEWPIPDVLSSCAVSRRALAVRFEFGGQGIFGRSRSMAALTLILLIGARRRALMVNRVYAPPAIVGVQRILSGVLGT